MRVSSSLIVLVGSVKSTEAVGIPFCLSSDSVEGSRRLPEAFVEPDEGQSKLGFVFRLVVWGVPGFPSSLILVVFWFWLSFLLWRGLICSLASSAGIDWELPFLPKAPYFFFWTGVEEEAPPPENFVRSSFKMSLMSPSTSHFDCSLFVFIIFFSSRYWINSHRFWSMTSCCSWVWESQSGKCFFLIN